MAAFIACSVLLSLGCLIGLKKSALFPSMAIRFLGCISDSLKGAVSRNSAKLGNYKVSIKLRET